LGESPSSSLTPELRRVLQARHFNCFVICFVFLVIVGYD
jgi:hypothetical protein